MRGVRVFREIGGGLIHTNTTSSLWLMEQEPEIEEVEVTT